MKTTVSSKGKIVLPAELRQRDKVEPGQKFDVERLGTGDYRLVRRAPRPNEGVVDWLLACPRKGYFVPIDSESTDSLLTHDLTVATRSRADFTKAGLTIVDPFA